MSKIRKEETREKDFMVRLNLALSLAPHFFPHLGGVLKVEGREVGGGDCLNLRFDAHVFSGCDVRTAWS